MSREVISQLGMFVASPSIGTWLPDNSLQALDEFGENDEETEELKAKRQLQLLVEPISAFVTRFRQENLIPTLEEVTYIKPAMVSLKAALDDVTVKSHLPRIQVDQIWENVTALVFRIVRSLKIFLQ